MRVLYSFLIITTALILIVAVGEAARTGDRGAVIWCASAIGVLALVDGYAAWKSKEKS